MAVTVDGTNPYNNTLGRINNSLQKTMQTLATGSKYPSASFGASEAAIVAQLDSNIGATRQSTQNSKNIAAMINIAAGATQNTVSALTKLKELAINAANDTNGSIDRQALQENVNQIIRQIDENAYAEYNGKYVVNGSQKALTVAGIDGYENFNMGDIRAQSLGLTDKDGNITIDVSTVEAANKSLAIIDDALDYARVQNDSLHFMEEYVNEGISLNEALDVATTQGAQLSRLEYQQANYTTMEENMLAAQSTIGDTDMAAQITQMNNLKILEQLANLAKKQYEENQADNATNAVRMVQ